MSGGGGSTGGSGGTECPSGRGPNMVNVGAYCIDSIEVTRGHYEEFLEAVTQFLYPVDIPPACQAIGKTSFKPRTTWPCEEWSGGWENFPASCLDWCDAHAFCEWAGKELCGPIGDTFDYSKNEHRSPLTSQWMHACSRGGTSEYAYGNQTVESATHCNIKKPYLNAGPAPAMNYPKCHGQVAPYDQVWDMHGNVAEWTAACPTPEACHLNGSHHSDAELPCSHTDHQPIFTAGTTTGFRCCSKGKK